MQSLNTKAAVTRKLSYIQKSAIERGLSEVELKQYDSIIKNRNEDDNKSKRKLIAGALAGFIFLLLSVSVVNSLFSARCILPTNYVVWEATRPLANCSYCENVTKPIILRNVTRQDFAQYAYTSRPVIVKNAISHWRATKEFSYDLFKRLYETTENSYESLDEGCQFLNFKTDLFSLKEVFSMPKARVKNEDGQKPWYVGWGNCHPDILSQVRKYYSVPEFLPDDAELPATENIFFGYEIGAVMHLDYIQRLMWQGQVKGNKTWSIAPVPECDHVCHKFQYYVEPGDIAPVFQPYSYSFQRRKVASLTVIYGVCFQKTILWDSSRGERTVPYRHAFYTVAYHQYFWTLAYGITQPASPKDNFLSQFNQNMDKQIFQRLQYKT